MERKVTKFCNNLAITMTDALKQIGLDQGDTVSIEVSPATGEITRWMQESRKFTADMVNHQFYLQQTAAIIEAHCITIPKS